MRTVIGSLLMLAALGACSAPVPVGDSSGDVTIRPPAQTSSAAQAPSTEPSSSPESAQAEDPARLQTLRAAYLHEVAKGLDVQSPEPVDLVRWTTPQDFGDTMVTCLADAGFGATAQGGMQLQYLPVPDSQGRAQARAIYDCEAKYTLHPRFSAKPSAEALGAIYDWYVKVSAPCLRDRGIDVTEPPTRESFIASMAGGDAAAMWFPWRSVPRSITDSTADRENLERACPQSPDPTVYLGKTAEGMMN